MTISFIWFCGIRFLPLGIVRTSCKARVSITLVHRPCNYVDSIGVGSGLSPGVPVLLLFNEQVDLPSCCYTFTSSCSWKTVSPVCSLCTCCSQDLRWAADDKWIFVRSIRGEAAVEVWTATVFPLLHMYIYICTYVCMYVCVHVWCACITESIQPLDEMLRLLCLDSECRVLLWAFFLFVLRVRTLTRVYGLL